jgi:hypothetical protein
MSVPARHNVDNDERETASIYAPPWARDAVTDAADAAVGAAANLRRVLPAAPQLKDPELRLREPAPFDGEMQGLRAWPALNPVAVPGPPSQDSRRSVLPFVAWVSVAAGAATLVAALAGVGAPEWLRSANEGTRAFASRMFGTSTSSSKLADYGSARVANPPAPMSERVAAQPAAPPVAAPAMAAPVVAAAPAAAVAAQPPAVMERAVLPGPSPITPPVPSMDPEEIAALYRRGEQLVTQGAIAAARLVFMRAAESGDARSALALGATYDPEVLRKLGVIGVAGDAALAREWYGKASSYGSREAAQRIELMAHGR